MQNAPAAPEKYSKTGLKSAPLLGFPLSAHFIFYFP
jgi:hypothetical protein